MANEFKHLSCVLWITVCPGSCPVPASHPQHVCDGTWCSDKPWYTFDLDVNMCAINYYNVYIYIYKRISSHPCAKIYILNSVAKLWSLLTKFPIRRSQTKGQTYRPVLRRTISSEVHNSLRWASCESILSVQALIFQRLRTSKNVG